jgi:RNA polymerase sigma-70 factor (ECF subfamily)
VIKVEDPQHYPDMQAAVAGLDVGVLPTASVRSSEDDHTRITRLVRREFNFIWRLLRRLGLPEEDADDGAQQVFLVASRRVSVMKAGSERSFLFGTALRVASRMRKQRAKLAHLDLEAVAAHHDPTLRPDELAERTRAREQLDAILATLHDDLRVAFVLYEIEELTMAEIATLLAIPAGTVASRLRRARELFAQQVALLHCAPKVGNHG